MKISITVYKTTSKTGYDRARLGGDYPVINTVSVRYPDVNRAKGEPHDVQEFFDVPCQLDWDESATNGINEAGAFCNKPDLNAINKLIEKYKKLGDVTVFYN